MTGPTLDISVGKFKPVGKFEGEYFIIFCLLRSQKTFRTRSVKNWIFADHKNDAILLEMKI